MTADHWEGISDAIDTLATFFNPRRGRLAVRHITGQRLRRGRSPTGHDLFVTGPNGLAWSIDV